LTYRVVSTSPSFGKFVTEPIEFFRRNGWEVELRPELKTEDLLVQNLANYDAVITGFEPITAKVIAAAPKLRVVAKHGAGVDNIDIPAATKAGVVVVSAAGVNSEAVAEMTIGLFLALARAIPLADRQTRAGGWPRLAGAELAHKTVGIVGFGQIGRLVAKRVAGFETKVLAHDAFVSADAARQHGAELTSLDRLLAEADYISLHVPLTKETRGLIAADQLKRMKKTAFLVNVSRGGIVDEQALCDALKAKAIGGAALDVFDKEPPGSSPLFDLENFIAAPHMAGYTLEAVTGTGMVCAQGILDVFAGRTPDNIVNKDVVPRK
jgi:D-3-phosphoglycerate dehydrogenase / 2-oxoglutarate reductase